MLAAKPIATAVVGVFSVYTIISQQRNSQIKVKHPAA